MGVRYTIYILCYFYSTHFKYLRSLLKNIVIMGFHNQF
jgi:hypothetical protein